MSRLNVTSAPRAPAAAFAAAAIHPATAHTRTNMWGFLSCEVPRTATSPFSPVIPASRRFFWFDDLVLTRCSPRTRRIRREH